MRDYFKYLIETVKSDDVPIKVFSIYGVAGALCMVAISVRADSREMADAAVYSLVVSQFMNLLTIAIYTLSYVREKFSGNDDPIRLPAEDGRTSEYA